MLSSVGRAAPLQGVGRRFEPVSTHHPGKGEQDVRLFLCAPSMGALLRVQVPSQVDHDERSEAQLHEGDRVWEGSVEHKL